MTGAMVQGVVELDAALLRAGAGELVLRAGRVLAARVAERHGAHGVLVIAGTPLVARLPGGVREGDELRLVVDAIEGDRVLLRVEAQPQPVAAPLPPVALALPHGQAWIHPADPDEGGGAAAGDGPAVALRWTSPVLGDVDLRLALTAGAVAATVRLAPGRALELAGDGADALRAALTAATGRPARVEVGPRRERVDLRA
jgi:hypothetical protein